MSSKKRGIYYDFRGPKELRKQKREMELSLQDIAKLVGAKRHAVWKWLRGLSRPVLRVRRRLQYGLAIRMEWWVSPEELAKARESLESFNRQEELTDQMMRDRRKVVKIIGKAR